MRCIDAVFQASQSPVLGQDITRKALRFRVRHHPLMCSTYHYITSPLCQINIHMKISPRPSPSVFAYCKVSKTVWWWRPGNKAMVHWFVRVQVIVCEKGVAWHYCEFIVWRARLCCFTGESGPQDYKFTAQARYWKLVYLVTLASLLVVAGCLLPAAVTSGSCPASPRW